ncbi:hypothetical protein [Streptomyces sp. DSM 40750]|uniref:hypothetical protein n=1 Tax=Streptomyces sp. DSM 40750 TaxID=2801030 RepID=UPI00214BC860|nr:hypothetical protein [Streptomyces sp. DSM 40750]UUU24655.1 hypothetical protein JIX55_32820 [Streptomyces sp. DSM 40750]
MEQRIGSNNQPLAAAAVDPSHIPGLTAPVSVKKEKQEEPEDIKPTEPVEPTKTAEPDEAAPDKDEPTAAEKTPAKKTSAKKTSVEKTAAEKTSDDDEVDPDVDADSEAEGEAEDEATADGPVFEASDRRAKIVADSRGVRLRLDDQECEFRWDEIGAIETESPRFGKRFTITVHTPDRRWYPIEIEAKAKSEHAAWETGIDEVLDAYFEDGEDEKAADEKAADEKAADEKAADGKEAEESAP